MERKLQIKRQLNFSAVRYMQAGLFFCERWNKDRN